MSNGASAGEAPLRWVGFTGGRVAKRESALGVEGRRKAAGTGAEGGAWGDLSASIPTFLEPPGGRRASIPPFPSLREVVEHRSHPCRASARSSGGTFVPSSSYREVPSLGREPPGSSAEVLEGGRGEPANLGEGRGRALAKVEDLGGGRWGLGARAGDLGEVGGGPWRRLADLGGGRGPLGWWNSGSWPAMGPVDGAIAGGVGWQERCRPCGSWC